MVAHTVRHFMAARGTAVVSGGTGFDMSTRDGVEILVIVNDEGPCGVVRRDQPQMIVAGPAIPGHLCAAQALEVMRASGRDDLPVLDGDGVVIGLVSRADMDGVYG